MHELKPIGNEPRRIRVLRVISRMNIGGPAIQITTLAKGLEGSAIEEVLLIGECGPEESDYLVANNILIRHKVVPGLGRRVDLFSDIRAFYFIWRQILKLQPDIVHTHTFKAGLLGRLATFFQLKRPKCVHTFHGHLLYGYWSGLRLDLLKKIERSLAKRTDVLIAVGNQVMNDLINNGIGKRNQYLVVPPGFPMNVSKKGSGPLFSVRELHSEFVCLWVGRMAPIKRPERLLELGRESQSRGLNFKFWIVGDGPLRQQIELESTKAGLPLRFLGWRHDVHDLLVEADVLILTSDNEGTPLSIIEAQRLGRPVVATDVGSVREVMDVDKSGFAIKYSPNTFIDKLASLAGNRQLYFNQSRNAEAFASKNFSPERLVGDHIRIYENLMRD